MQCCCDYCSYHHATVLYRYGSVPKQIQYGTVQVVVSLHSKAMFYPVLSKNIKAFTQDTIDE